MDIEMRAHEPELAPGDPAPGRWIDSGDGVRRWEGPCHWIVRHGNAIVKYETGEVVDIIGARTPDGTRCYLVRRKAGAPDMWARAVGRGKWLIGKLRIESDEVFFDDAPVQVCMDQDEATSLDIDLLSSKAIHVLCSDLKFCMDLYSALAGTTWLREGDGVKAVLSWRNAADLVAGLHGNGTTHEDFFLSGSEGTVEPHVERALGVHTRWRPMPGEAPDADARHREALDILLECEARRPAQTPNWYPLTAPHDGGDPADRLHRAAYKGQVGRAEWDRFWQLVDLGDD